MTTILVYLANYPRRKIFNLPKTIAEQRGPCRWLVHITMQIAAHWLAGALQCCRVSVIC